MLKNNQNLKRNDATTTWKSYLSIQSISINISIQENQSFYLPIPSYVTRKFPESRINLKNTRQERKHAVAFPGW